MAGLNRKRPGGAPGLLFTCLQADLIQCELSLYALNLLLSSSPSSSGIRASLAAFMLWSRSSRPLRLAVHYASQASKLSLFLAGGRHAGP